MHTSWPLVTMSLAPCGVYCAHEDCLSLRLLNAVQLLCADSMCTAVSCTQAIDLRRPLSAKFGASPLFVCWRLPVTAM